MDENKKESPLVKGGQGRSADDIERDAKQVFMLTCVLVVFAIVGLFI